MFFLVKLGFSFMKGLDFDDYWDEERLFAGHSPDCSGATLMGELTDLIERVAVCDAFFQSSHEDLRDIAEKHFAIAGEDDSSGLNVRPCHHTSRFFGDGDGDDDDALREFLTVFDDGAADIADADAIDHDVAMWDILLEKMASGLVEEKRDAVLEKED